MMRHFNYLVVVFFLLFTAQAYAYDAPQICGGGDDCYTIQSGDIWVMTGDSLSHARMGTIYLEAYYQLRYPALDLRFRTASRGGTIYSHLFDDVLYGPDPPDHEYAKTVQPWEPDIVSGFYGHNNGDDRDGDSETSYNEVEIQVETETFVDDYVIDISSAQAVLFGNHAMYQTGGNINMENRSAVVPIVGEASNLPYADIFDTEAAIYDAAIADGDTTGVAFDFISPDIVHPGEGGHLMETWAILTSLGVDDEVSQATINASVPSTTSSTDCTISSLTGSSNGIAFTRLDTRLPWAWDEEADSVFEYAPDIPDDLSKLMLTVTGLSSGDYSVYIDDELLAIKTAAELAAGWNIADVQDGPYWDQGLDVIDKIRLKEGVALTNVSNVYARTGPPWSGVEAFISAGRGYYNSGDRGQDLIDSLATYISNTEDLDDDVHTAATPVARDFRIEGAGAGIQHVKGTHITGGVTWQ